VRFLSSLYIVLIELITEHLIDGGVFPPSINVGNLCGCTQHHCLEPNTNRPARSVRCSDDREQLRKIVCVNIMKESRMTRGPDLLHHYDGPYTAQTHEAQSRLCGDGDATPKPKRPVRKG
jgi:hypothetical protein